MKPIDILIVEDELSVAKSLALKLEDANYNVVGIVDSGIEAIQQVAETTPDLILMDIILKGQMDGIDASKQIKTQYEIPIIYLTSLTDRATLKRARETQPQGYAIKPYNFEDLKATIETALSSLQNHNSLKTNFKKVHRKAKTATHKIKTIATKTLNLPSPSSYDRALKREKYRPRLPQLSPQDARIVETLQQEGVCLTSLTALKLPHTKRLVKELKTLYPHLYTLAKGEGWRTGIPSLRKFLHTEILLWGLEKRLLDLVENYIGLPLLFHGVDLRKDVANAPLTDARHWHLDIDDERMVKVIVYLNNVGDSGGPFEYIPRSFTQQIVDALGYTSGFVTEEAMNKVISSQQRKICAARAGSIIITDTCNVFHRAKPAQRNRYSITFGYTSRIPQVCLSEFKLSPEEWQRITPSLNKRQIACLRRDKLVRI